MRTLTKKSEITAKNLKEKDCDYRGFRIGFDTYYNQYIVGSHFNKGVDLFDTISELRGSF